MNDFTKIFNKFSVIKQIPIFSHLSWFEIHTISQKCELIEFKKGDLICKQGDRVEAFYCLVSGRLEAYLTTPTGRKENVELVLQGTPFGIISLFSGQNYGLNFEAINDSIVLRIAKDDFSLILKMIPHLGIEFSQSISKQVYQRENHQSHHADSSIIAIYSPVKDSGSSTFALNLAFNLEKETSRKVILVSINAVQKDESLNISPLSEATPFWKKEAVNLKDILGNYRKTVSHITTGDFNIDLLNVVFDLHDSRTINQISQFVSILVHDYFYVVVDLPNDLDDVVMQTLTQADRVFLLSQKRKQDLALTKQVLEDLRQRLKSRFFCEKVHLVLSQLNSDGENFSVEEAAKIVEYPIEQSLPVFDRTHLTRSMLAKNMSVVLPDTQCDYSQILRRMSRHIGGVSIGLVLGGGAALGVAHVGVIRVLERAKIPIDMVVGSSMGALIGSLWAIGNDANQLEEIAYEFEKKPSLMKLLDPVFPKSGFVGGRLIRLWLKKHLGEKTFGDTRIPLKIVSYDLIRRQEHIVDTGSLVDAVRESVAIPGVVEPVFRDGKIIIDGGVLNPLPTNVLQSRGIKKIIAVNVLQSPEDVSRGFDMDQKQMEEDLKVHFIDDPLKYCGVRLKKRFYVNIPDIIIRTLQASEYMLAEKSSSIADVNIHPDLTGINWFELYEVKRLIKSGQESAEKHLEEIYKLTSSKI